MYSPDLKNIHCSFLRSLSKLYHSMCSGKLKKMRMFKLFYPMFLIYSLTSMKSCSIPSVHQSRAISVIIIVNGFAILVNGSLLFFILYFKFNLFLCSLIDKTLLKRLIILWTHTRNDMNPKQDASTNRPFKVLFVLTGYQVNSLISLK